ncbi:MAG TPA: hypothetical protein VE078_18580 [Thermoanaerobaculia bacterium]|nr:hypothetical protein [Thermoanaerobaculia bacterium]
MASDTEKRRKKDDPDARLLLVLLRYFAGWWEKGKLAAAAGFGSSQVAMWDRGDRPVPRYALHRTADVAGFPRHLIAPALRTLRSFRLAAKGKTRAGRALAEVSLIEAFPLAASALDLILEPLSPDAIESPDEAEILWERLSRRPWNHRWLMVQNIHEFRSQALAERVVGESQATADPREALELAKLALRIAELAPPPRNEALLQSLKATVSLQPRS